MTNQRPDQEAVLQSIKIPTDTMEQEFATHERRGYAKGFAAGKVSQPVQPECLHDETERLGAIWMHCTQCGKKWADDEIVPTTQPVQPEQEPVAWRYPRAYGHWDVRYWLNRPSEGHRVGEEPLYTSPPQRQPLTDDEIVEALMPATVAGAGYYMRLARAIEAAHGIVDKT